MRFRHEVIDEAPPGAHHDVVLLGEMRDAFGNRRALVARELTKKHEELFRGTLDECIAHFGREKVLGEVTVVVEGARPAEGEEDRE